jgi:hypothetical protein
MSIGRYYHTCFLLLDGRAVAAGGYYGCTGGDINTMEVYDKASGTWSPYQLKLPYSSESAASISLDGIPYYVGG